MTIKNIDKTLGIKVGLCAIKSFMNMLIVSGKLLNFVSFDNPLVDSIKIGLYDSSKGQKLEISPSEK